MTVLLLALAGDEVTLEGPTRAAEADMVEALRALSARCGTAGMKGLKMRVVVNGSTPRIVVSDVTPAQRRAIARLAAFAGRTVALHRTWRLKADDEGRYAPGKTSAADRAPSGARWARAAGPDGSVDESREAELVHETAAVHRGNFGRLRDPSKPEAHYELGESSTRRIRELLEDDRGGGFLLLIDGYRLTGDWGSRTAVLELSEEVRGRQVPLARGRYRPPCDPALLDPILRHPMPFALKIAK